MSGTKVEETHGPLRMAWGLGAILALLLAMSVSACNTMEGAGEDISAAGGAMSDTAEDVEDDMD
jgi:predicted small secreted protein